MENVPLGQSLQGSLPGISIVDLLHLLATSAKTGMLLFARGQGGVTQNGAVCFSMGVPIAAESDGVNGEAGLELLCSWERGDFVFHEGLTGVQQNLGRPLEQLVERCVEAREEWMSILRTLPDASTRLSLCLELPEDSEGVQLNRGEWRLVAGMSHPHILSSLVQKAGGGIEAYRQLRGLLEEGLLKAEMRDPRVSALLDGGNSAAAALEATEWSRGSARRRGREWGSADPDGVA